MTENRSSERGKPKMLVGVVTSDKMDKTVIVDVSRIRKHKTYTKPIKTTSSFKAHDQRNECKVGDKVLIIGTRPLSKTKSWRVSKIIERAKTIEGEILDDFSPSGGNGE